MRAHHLLRQHDCSFVGAFPQRLPQLGTRGFFRIRQAAPAATESAEQHQHRRENAEKIAAPVKHQKQSTIENRTSQIRRMPSFDIVSEVDSQELDNAINQARKELATRFDFKGSTAEMQLEKDKIVLTAEDGNRLRGLREILIMKLSKRGIDLRNLDQQEPAISSMGHARQELLIKQGLDGEKAKEIIKAIKAGDFKVQSTLQERQIRVTGKKRDDLQAVIQFVRGKDFGVATNFKNFRD
jgi:cyclic-di-GMP-binding protein